MARPRKFPFHLKNRYGKVSVYQTVNGIYVSFKIVWQEGSVRRKESRPDEEAAVDRAHEILGDIAKGAETRPDATAQQWAYFQKCEAALGGVPLLTAVEYYLKHGLKKQAVESLDVAEVVARYLASRKASGRGERYLATLKYDLTPVGEVMCKPIDRVTVVDLDAYLLTIPNARTRSNKRGSICSCWRWAQRKGWLAQGIPTAADQTDSPTVEYKDPEIIVHTQLESAFRFAEADPATRPLVPYMAIAAFAGVRSAEICRLTWEEHIDLDEGLILLGSDITKTKRRRVVYLEPVLCEWLKAHRSTGKVVKVQKPHNLLISVHQGRWPHNALRHSAVSYLMALHENAAKIANQSGHSETQLQTEYKALATKRAALQWFGVKPLSITLEPNSHGK